MSVMTDLTLDRAVERLARGERIRLERDCGGSLDVVVSRTFGRQVTGTVDRLRVVGGLVRLYGEVVVDDRMCRVEFEIERAVFDSEQTARVQLVAVGVETEEHRPRHHFERHPVRGRAAITALYTQNVIDGTTFDAEVQSLALDGLSFCTWRAIRPGDELLVRARLHSIRLQSELVVEAVLPTGDPEEHLVECAFLKPARHTIASVEGILSIHQSRGSAALFDFSAVRRALVDAGEEPAARRRGLFHRFA